MKSLAFLFAMTLTTGVFAFDAGKHFKANCIACHTVGGGDKIGPDLAGLSKRRKLDWLVKFVKYPEGMIMGDDEEEGYEKPDALAKKVYEKYKPQMMSDQELTKDQMKAILKWIDDQKKSPKGKILTVK